MQAKAKLRGDHHGLSLPRLLRDELSLPACLFPTSPGGWDWGVWGSWRFPTPPCREGGVYHWLCPPAAGQQREHVGREQIAQDPCRHTECQCPASVLVPCSGHGIFRFHDGERCWPWVLGAGCWQCHFHCIGSTSPTQGRCPSLQGPVQGGLQMPPENISSDSHGPERGCLHAGNCR